MKILMFKGWEGGRGGSFEEIFNFALIFNQQSHDDFSHKISPKSDNK